MFGLGYTEIAIIVIVFILLFYGGGKIGEFAKSLGRFSGEFKKGKMEVDKEIREATGSGDVPPEKKDN